MAVAVVAGLSAVGGQAITVGLAQFTLAMATKAFVLGAGLSMISRALQPKLEVGQNTGLTTSVSNPIAERPIIYGRTRTGGTIVYFTTSGSDSKFLHLVIAVAGHAIDGYEKVYFDDQVIWEDGSYVDDWVQNAQINFYDGTQTTADQDLINASNEWNSNCILNDTAYIHVRLEYDPEVYTNGIPSITTTIRGKKVYDPRTDVTEWSENPALCIYDYLQDPKYGLNDDTVNVEQVKASANVCDQLVTIDTGVDQTRYALSGFISTGDTVKANIEKMLSSMFGRLVCTGGELFINAGYYTLPVLDIDESMLVGEVSLQTKTSRRNTYNAVKGTFLSEEENYIFADYPSIKSDTYSVEDGEPLYLDLPLPCTTNNVRAQRLAKLSLNKSRQQRTLSIPVNLAGLKVRAGDVIRFTSERLGISNAEYEVIDFEFEYSDQLIVNLVCVETGASLYDWTVADKLDFSVGSDITLYDGSAVAPTDLTATAVSNILSDGTDSTYIDVAWTNPSDIYFDYVVLKYGSQSIVTKDQSYRINNVDENTQYTITISAYNTFGRQSTGLSTNVTTVRDTTAPADIVIDTNDTVAGLQSITLNWTNPSDDDFDLVRIKVASTNVEPASHSYEVRADNFIDDVGAYSATRYYWLAPVDRTGNVGNYVSGGSATTGSIDYSDVGNTPNIPEVATTAYLTLPDNDAPTDVEFNTAVGRDPIENDSAIINKEYAFTYNGTAWTAVTEFIDGSLLVTDSVTASEINVTNLSSLSSDLGDVTAGSIDINSGVFTVNSSGDMTATSAVIDGNITAESLDVENATVTGTFIAPIGWSDGVYSGVINRGNLNESVKDLIDERIAEVTGGISGDFGQDDGSFSYIAQGNPDPDNPIVLNITHENGKDLTVELSGSRSWNRQFIGLPDTDMGVTIILERSPAGADTWTTLETLTDSGNSITTSGPTLIHSSTYAYSISIYHVLTDDQASGNYDYRARTTVAGSAYNVGIPLQLTVVEPATVGAGNADTLDNEDGTYYLNYNNFTNTPSTTNWDTAYSWGDHASAGYLKYTTSSGTAGESAYLLSIGKATDHQYIQSHASQPLRLNPAGNSVQVGTGAWNLYHTGNFTDNSSNWNTAYGWGDHGTQGYLTEVPNPITKDLVIGGSSQVSWGRPKIGNYDIGWGAHPSIGSDGGSAGQIIMLANPHIPYRTDNERTGASGRAGIRCGIDATQTSWWDIGLTGDQFEIYRSASTTQLMTLNNAGNAGFAGAVSANGFTVSSGNITFANDTASGIRNTAGNAGYRPDDAYGNTYIYNTVSGKGFYGDFDNYFFRDINGSNRVEIRSTGLNVKVGNLLMNGTTVIDSSRNLANIPSINNNGSDIIIGPSNSTRLKTRHVDGKDYNSDDDDHLYLNYDKNKEVYIGGGNGSGGLNILTGAIKIGGTVTIDASRNTVFSTVNANYFKAIGADHTPLGTAFSNVFHGGSTNRTAYFDGYNGSCSVWFGEGNNAHAALDSNDGQMGHWVNTGSTWNRIFTATTSGINLETGSYLVNSATVIDSARNATFASTTTGLITMNQTSTYGYFGSASFSWAGNSTYPTIFGGSADRWVMICFPHIPYMENGQRGFTGTTRGAVTRYEGDIANTTYWDAGVKSNIGANSYSISLNNTDWTLNINSSDKQVNARYGYKINGTSVISSARDATFNGLTVTKTAHNYLQINGNGSYEAMVRYDNGISNYWYTGIRTSTQLVGNTGYHVYSSAAGQTVWGATAGGEIRSKFNVVAYYSDDRLKTKVATIDNALSKVCSLNGFIYVENDTAKELGYDSNREQVGLSAQEVQSVLPQAVRLAPVDCEVDEQGNDKSISGEDYLTLDYAKVVPLLVEAIKELKQEIEELKNGNNTN